MSKKIGDVILDIQNISLRFGGVKALTDISFNVREHEVRAIQFIAPSPVGRNKRRVQRCFRTTSPRRAVPAGIAKRHPPRHVAGTARRGE